MQKKAIFLIFLFFVVIAQEDVATCQEVPPDWMCVGAYAEYSFSSIGIAFINGTHFDAKNLAQIIFRWECLERNQTVAKLTSKLVLTEENTITISTEVYVNLENRRVYFLNGTLIGATMLWVQANRKPSEELLLWDTPNDRISSRTENFTVLVETPQGKQESLIVHAIGIIQERSVLINRAYDINTGIMVDGSISEDAIASSNGIDWYGRIGQIKFLNTNINLGTREFNLYGFAFLGIPLFMVSILAFLILTSARKRIAKRKKVLNQTLSNYKIDRLIKQGHWTSSSFNSCKV
jgi:hypothetical protein